MKNFFLASLALMFSATVARAEMIAQFTDKVENREPVNKIESVSKGSDERITFYSVIEDQTDTTVYHVWKNGDTEFYRKDYNVGGPRWRVWSSVTTEHFEVGDKATVDVVDADGNVLYTETIEIK